MQIGCEYELHLAASRVVSRVDLGSVGCEEGLEAHELLAALGLARLLWRRDLFRTLLGRLRCRSDGLVRAIVAGNVRVAAGLRVRDQNHAAAMRDGGRWRSDRRRRS